MLVHRRIRHAAGKPYIRIGPSGTQNIAAPALVVVTLLVLVSAGFGGNFLAIRFVVHALPPFSLQAIRFLIAGIALYAYAYSRKGCAKPTLQQWRTACIGGVLLLFGGQGAVSWSLQYVSAGIAALMCATIPLWVTIIGVVFFRVRVRPLGLVGILCGFVGLLPIVLPHITGSAGPLAIGVLLFGMISWSVGTVFGARVSAHDDALLATAMQLLIGGALLFITALASGEPRRIDWPAITPSALWGMAHLIFFGSIVAYTAYVWLLKNAPPSVPSMFAYLAPIVTLALGSLLHEETLGLTTIAGGLVNLAGVALVVATRNGSSAPTSSPPRGEEPIAADRQRPRRA